MSDAIKTGTTDAEADAILDKIVQDEPEPAVEVVEEEEEQSPLDQTPAAEPRKRSEEVLEAVKALRLAGYDDEDFVALSDASLLRKYESKLKNDRDVRRTFQENAELRRRLDDLEGAKAAERTAPAVAEDFVSKELVETFGEEEARAIAKWQQAREKPLQQELQMLRGFMEEMLVDRVWSRLETEGVFGQELPEGARDAVLGEARMLAAAGKHASLAGEAKLAALLRDGAKLALPGAAAGVTKEARTSGTEPDKRKGAVTRPPSRTIPAKKLTAEEAADQKLSAILDGETDVGALRRRFGY